MGAPSTSEAGLKATIQEPSRLIFRVKVNIPVKDLRHEECRSTFLLIHGPRSLEFEYSVNVSGMRPENPSLVVSCLSDLDVQIPGMIAMRFGVSKDINPHENDDEKPIDEVQEINFDHIFVMRGDDPFLESLLRAVRSERYVNDCIALTIFIIYEVAEFLNYVKRNNRLRSLSPQEQNNVQKIVDNHRDFEIISNNSCSVMYSKSMLYMGSKYFHRLIDEDPSTNNAKFNYSHDVIVYALCLAFHNKFSTALYDNVSEMRETIQLLCLLEPININVTIETIAMELKAFIFDNWERMDLDNLIQILLLPKYWELESLKETARSVIFDVHDREFRMQYNQYSKGARCAAYRELISSGTLDEVSDPLPSEVEKLTAMRWKSRMVRKSIEYVEKTPATES